MAMRTKPPHEVGFTILAVLVTLSLVSALLFGLWQQLDLNRDALLSERSYCTDDMRPKACTKRRYSAYKVTPT